MYDKQKRLVKLLRVFANEKIYTFGGTINFESKKDYYKTKSV
jgi:hypothetical protein